MQDGQQAALETSRSEDGISPTKLREPGSTVGKNEGKQEEKQASQKEASWADLIKAKPAEGRGIETMNTPP